MSEHNLEIEPDRDLKKDGIWIPESQKCKKKVNIDKILEKMDSEDEVILTAQLGELCETRSRTRVM